jgi:hypothetical protein
MQKKNRERRVSFPLKRANTAAFCLYDRAAGPVGPLRCSMALRGAARDLVPGQSQERWEWWEWEWEWVCLWFFCLFVWKGEAGFVREGNGKYHSLLNIPNRTWGLFCHSNHTRRKKCWYLRGPFETRSFGANRAYRRAAPAGGRHQCQPAGAREHSPPRHCSRAVPCACRCRGLHSAPVFPRA